VTVIELFTMLMEGGDQEEPGRKCKGGGRPGGLVIALGACGRRELKKKKRQSALRIEVSGNGNLKKCKGVGQGRAHSGGEVVGRHGRQKLLPSVVGRIRRGAQKGGPHEPKGKLGDTISQGGEGWEKEKKGEWETFSGGGGNFARMGNRISGISGV